MTSRRDLDRNLDHELAAYLAARSTDRAPAGLLEAALARVDSTRQRPGWLPRRPRLASPLGERSTRVAFVAIALVLLLALAVALALVVGSPRRLPLPFGLARPGLITYDIGGEVYTAGPDGTGQVRLTSGHDAAGYAAFSPDGTRIAIQEGAPDMSTSLVVMEADGSHRVTVMEHLALAGDITWSPDSRHLAVSARLMGSDQDAFHVYVADIDHPGATELGGPDMFGAEPSWSPDGTRIAFKRLYPCCDNPIGLWIMDADGTHAHRLSKATGGYADTSLWNTSWSPDGRQLAFLADGVGGRYDVFVINADGTGEVNITKSPQQEYWAAWSPDGRRIAFPRMDPPSDISGTFIVTDPDGGNPVTLAGTAVNSNQAVWSPDARRFLGYVVDPSTGANIALGDFDPSGRSPPVIIPLAGYGSASWQRLAP